MDKNKTKHKNMFFKKLFICESRLVFMNEKPSETTASAAEKPAEKQKQKQPEKNEIEKYKENYAKIIGPETKVRVEFTDKFEKHNLVSAGTRIFNSLREKHPLRNSAGSVFGANAGNFGKELALDIAELIEKNSEVINNNIPVTIQLGPNSSLSFYAKGNKQSFLEFNMLTEAPRLKEVEAKKKELEEAKAKETEKANEKKQEFSKEIEKHLDSGNFVNQLISEKGDQYLKETDENGVYKVNFIDQKGKVDRKAEHDVQIQDLLDLSRLKGGNMYIRVYLDGKSQSGVPHKYWAYYHPSQKTFIREGTTQRALIFHGTKISQITYEAYKPKEREQLPQEEKAKAQTVSQEETKKLEAIREQKIRENELTVLEKNKNYVFKNQDFKVPGILREDSDFEANWDRIDQGLEEVLTRAPFNLKTTEERRVYVQNSIQEWSNKNLNAEDFFKIPVNGQPLYKGGYEKFKEDYKKNGQNEASLEQLAIGIAKVFEALKNLKLLEKKPETNSDKYRTKFLGLERQTVLTKETPEAEKAGMTETISYSAYGDQSLGALLHSKENAPRNFYVGVTNKNINEIQALALKNGYEIKGLNVPDLVKEDGGLKLLFMTFGLDELIKRGCVKRVNENKYVLVKVPQDGWEEAFKVLAKNKAKLRDKSKENYNKWETVRAAVSEGVRSRNFILKIFNPKGSKVSQNLNWWRSLFNEKEKKVTMAYLKESSTLNPKEFEKYLASDRGYLDMIKKTSERHGETGIYEPKEAKVLTLANTYLYQGLNYAFKLNVKSESEKAVESVTDKILKDFNILSVKSELKRPLNKNKLENLEIIFKKIELKNLDTSKLSKAYISMIQMGYVETRNIETMGLQAEKLEATGLATQEPYRSIQEEALKNGLPEEKLADLEKKIAITLFALANGETPPGMKIAAGGLGASVLIGNFKGKKMYLHFGLAGVKNGEKIPLTAFAGVSGDIGKLGGFKLKYNIGASPDFAGAALTMEHKFAGNWDWVANAGAGVSVTDFENFGIGASIGVKWDQLRAEKQAKNKELSSKGLGQIEESLKNGNYDEAVKFILENPTFGDYMKFIKNTYPTFPNSVLIEMYQAAKNQWAEKAKEGVKIPFVQGAGVGIGISKAGIGIGPYVTIKIPGTEVIFVVRSEHPKYSGYWQTEIAQESLRRKLRKATGTEPFVSGYTMTAQSGNLFFDSERGGANVEVAGIGELVKRQEGNIKGTFEAVKSKFNKMDMHVEIVPDPSNSNNTLLAITPLNTDGSNVQVLMDPEMQKKGIILDHKNNRILLAASEAKKLFFTRSEYRYPFAEKGAMNLEVITFKNNPDRTDEQIREDSAQIIYKPMGSRYMVVKGEARTGLSEAESNTLTIEEYNTRGNTFENFKDKKFEYNLNESTDLTSKMWETLKPKEAAPIRSDLVKQTSKSYLSKNESFERKIAEANTPAKEAALKVEVFRNLKTIDPSLNDQELNLIYNYMLNEVFIELRDKNKNVINQRLERRNELFRAYIKNYISDYAKNNPAQWAEIVKTYPSATPDSIANYLMLTMPQNKEQLDEFSKPENGVAVGRGLKFASYTKKNGKDTLAASYGTEVPEDFKDIFKMVGPKRLRLDSASPVERAAARIIFETMSPLETKNLDSIEGKKKFLESELSLLLISMFVKYDGKMISPLIEILGKENYKGMTEIYAALKRGGEALELTLSKPENEKAFKDFKELVTGIRNAQLEGKPSYIYNKKYEFTLDETEVYSGAYLKCGNGTIATRQKIGIKLIAGKEENVDWSSAKEEANILVNSKGAKTDLDITLALGVFRGRRKKEEVPDRHKPIKGEVLNRHTQGTTGQESQNSTPPVSEGPDNSI
ncbi:hypothetical protein C0416_02660 [bacterium]|nr:hypothetical protein [bacterium]